MIIELKNNKMLLKQKYKNNYIEVIIYLKQITQITYQIIKYKYNISIRINNKSKKINK